MLEEVRAPEPPVRLAGVFFEPGSAPQVAAELRALGEVVVGVGVPQVAGGGRAADDLLRRRGVAPAPLHEEGGRLLHLLAELGVFAPVAAGGAPEGQVPEGAFRSAPLFETNPDAVFCALQARRLPARRHPLGIRLRIAELEQNHVVDDGGDLWHRRIEEIEAAGVALCAHRYAVGHACWAGDPAEGVVVLPGSTLPAEFGTHGVIPPVERLQLPPVTGA